MKFMTSHETQELCMWPSGGRIAIGGGGVQCSQGGHHNSFIEMCEHIVERRYLIERNHKQ